MTNEQILRRVAAQLEQPATKAVTFGNRPANTRFFSLRADIAAHAHAPLSDGSVHFYCGSCFHWVRLPA